METETGLGACTDVAERWQQKYEGQLTSSCHICAIAGTFGGWPAAPWGPHSTSMQDPLAGQEPARRWHEDGKNHRGLTMSKFDYNHYVHFGLGRWGGLNLGASQIKILPERRLG